MPIKFLPEPNFPGSPENLIKAKLRATRRPSPPAPKPKRSIKTSSDRPRFDHIHCQYNKHILISTFLTHFNQRKRRSKLPTPDGRNNIELPNHIAMIEEYIIIAELPPRGIQFEL